MTTQPEALRLAECVVLELRLLHAQRDALLAALKQAENITAYAAGGMTHADWMTKRATEAHEAVVAAIKAVEENT
jgi:hypothetical protein